MLTATTVRMVKGAAASIILLLMTEPRGGNQEWLERYTGYSDKPVSTALSFLLENGMIVKTGDRGEYSYRLAGETRQLPLSPDHLGDGSKDESIPDHNYPVDIFEISPISDAKGAKEIESEKYSDSPSLASGFNQNLDSGIKPPPPGFNAESENFRLNLPAFAIQQDIHFAFVRTLNRYRIEQPVVLDTPGQQFQFCLVKNRSRLIRIR